MREIASLATPPAVKPHTLVARCCPCGIGTVKRHWPDSTLRVPLHTAPWSCRCIALIAAGTSLP
ncbi:hypothetical protein BD309DRAFT_972312 [Dichomitus squalens]|nr:hypothetical protein BD309DRAFT_972312 [Dichomitus squalens]